MKKLLLVPLLLLLACLLAGVYGILHDQVSYTVSPDYYHAFKFHQFQLSEALHNRWGAVVVGWGATWWMGMIIALPILSVGWIFADANSYARHSLIAFAVATTTALLVSTTALLFACLLIGQDHLPSFWYPEEEINRVAFARVGTMHNFSYLGGFAGIFVAIAYLAIARKRFKNSA